MIHVKQVLVDFRCLQKAALKSWEAMAMLDGPDHEVEVEVRPEEAARARHDVGVGLGSGRPLPLNSKRLTRVLLKQLARGLEIPSSSSGNEL